MVVTQGASTVGYGSTALSLWRCLGSDSTSHFPMHFGGAQYPAPPMSIPPPPRDDGPPLGDRGTGDCHQMAFPPSPRGGCTPHNSHLNYSTQLEHPTQIFLQRLRRL